MRRTMISRKHLKTLSYLCLLCLSVLDATIFASDKPNILFIIFDDLNDSVEGFGGHPQAKTPHLDKLAKRGIKFLNAQNNAPLCSPSRPSMLTGLYPHNTRYFGHPSESEGANGTYKKAWKHEVFKKSVTWMQHFRNHGYDVWGAGKIDHNFAERWSDWRSNGKLQYGPMPSWGPFPYKGSGAKPERHQMNMKVAVSHSSMPELPYISYFLPLSDIPDIQPNPAKGIAGYKGWYLYNKPYHYVSEADRDPMPDEQLAQWTENFFSERADSGKKQPFFLNIGINRPHEPMVAPDKYFDLFPLDEIQMPEGRKAGDLDDCATFMYKNLRTGKKSTSLGFRKNDKYIQKAYVKKFIQAYLANVAYADEMVGRILNALEKSPYADNTLIVVTSDNGYHMGEKDYFFKNSAWEESARAPLIFAGPGIPKNASCKTPVSLIDLYPTFNEIAGLPNDPHPHHPLDGHSMLPLLKEPTKGKWNGPKVALTAKIAKDLSNDKPIKAGYAKPAAQIYTVRSERYRYIICPDGGQELYDCEKDPHHWKNLASNPEYDDVMKNLHAEAERLTGQKLGVFYQPNTYKKRQ